MNSWLYFITPLNVIVSVKSSWVVAFIFWFCPDLARPIYKPSTAKYLPARSASSAVPVISSLMENKIPNEQLFCIWHELHFWPFPFGQTDRLS